MSNFNKEKEELSNIACSMLNNHLDFISELNETNPRLATILLLDFSFHLKMLKNLYKLKEEDN